MPNILATEGFQTGHIQPGATKYRHSRQHARGCSTALDSMVGLFLPIPDLKAEFCLARKFQRIE
jgi:hypothetical protein